jgi:hypothetical protein
MLEITIKMYDGVEHGLVATEDMLDGMLAVWTSGDGVLVVPASACDSRKSVDQVVARRYIHPRDIAEITTIPA